MRSLQNTSASFLAFGVLIGLAHSAAAESFTLIQTTPLTGLTSASGLEYLVSTDRFYVLDGFDTTDQLHVFNRAGAHVDAFSPGWAGQNFSQSGITTDPNNGNLLVLRDLSPPIFGPGAELFSVNPITRTGALDVSLDAATAGEVNSVAINPFNGNLIVSDSVAVGNSHIIELTRAGVFVREVVSDAALDALGVELGEAGSGIFSLTNEYIFTADFGPNQGTLYAVNLNTLATRTFFNPGTFRITGLAFGPTGDLAIIDGFDSDNLRLYDFDGDGVFTTPEPSSALLVAFGALALASYKCGRRFRSSPWRSLVTQHGRS